MHRFFALCAGDCFHSTIWNYRSNRITAAAIIAEAEMTTSIRIEAIISLRMFSYPLSYVLIYNMCDSVFKYYFPTVGHRYTCTFIKKLKKEIWSADPDGENK